MKNLIRIFLIVVIVGAGISIGSSCSDENDCSLAGRPMMYCTLYTIDEHTVFSINGMRIYDEAEHSQYQIWKYQK